MHSLTKCRIIEQVVHASQRGTIWSAYWGKIWTGVVMVGIFDLIFFQKLLFLFPRRVHMENVGNSVCSSDAVLPISGSSSRSGSFTSYIGV